MACIAMSENMWLKRVNNPSEHEKQIRKINCDCNCGWNKNQQVLAPSTKFGNL